MDLLNSELSAAKLATISEQKKNSVLLSQVDALEKDKAMLESSLEEMAAVRKENFNLKVCMEDKMSTLQDENHILRQNAISTSPPANNLSVVPKFFSKTCDTQDDEEEGEEEGLSKCIGKELKKLLQCHSHCK
ncbi:uncharacterized protein A4U43_C08F27940 [Asparagus officinalis]|nr:uncharacterized protein A4U43_C08F27940 [Asparagus officinalis]